MAKYYYKRYAAKIQYSLDSLTTTKRTDLSYSDFLTSYTYSGPWNTGFDNARTGLGCNPDTGLYIASKTVKANLTAWSANQYYMCGPVSPTCVYVAKAMESNGTTIKQLYQAMGRNTAWHYAYTIEPYYIADAYIDEVLAEDGTYPDNGVDGTHTYYYVKDRRAIEFYARTGGAWKANTPYVRVNGVWRPADVKPRVNGAWLG